MMASMIEHIGSWVIKSCYKTLLIRKLLFIYFLSFWVSRFLKSFIRVFTSHWIFLLINLNNFFIIISLKLLFGHFPDLYFFQLLTLKRIFFISSLELHLESFSLHLSRGKKLALNIFLGFLWRNWWENFTSSVTLIKQN